MPELQIGASRVGITWESLWWFLVFTAIGTVIGGIMYYYVQPYLPALPSAPAPPATQHASQVGPQPS